jgi:hypothetical protein
MGKHIEAYIYIYILYIARHGLGKFVNVYWTCLLYVPTKCGYFKHLLVYKLLIVYTYSCLFLFLLDFSVSARIVSIFLLFSISPISGID